MRETIILLCIGLLALVAVEVMILLFLVKRNISDPLAVNVRAAAQIANGNIEVQLAEIHSSDEIGSLNAAFRDMVAYLHQMANGAMQIAGGRPRPRIYSEIATRRIGQCLSANDRISTDHGSHGHDHR